jgi:GntR family histidine utilization transcriptional repressor
MTKSIKRPKKNHEFELPGGPPVQGALGERIKRFVVGKIESGVWPEGHHVPSESELAEGFGTARMTVHSALKDLAARGILLRRPGAGTRVAPRVPQSTLLEVRNIHDEINGRGHRHTAKVHLLEQTSCDLGTATELEVSPGSLVYHSVIVHNENDRPIQLEDRYVSPAFAPAYLRQDFTHVTPNEYLMSVGPLDEAEHVIQSLMPDRAMQSLLKMPAGDSVLHVRRRTWSGGIVVSSVRLIHPGSRYSLFSRSRVGRRTAG